MHASCRCRSILFHDIQDTTTLKLPLNPTMRPFYLGGVPLFWMHLLSRVLPSRVHTFTEQHSSFLPMFGIGLLLPNAHGTALADVSIEARPWPAFAQGPQQRIGTSWTRMPRPAGLTKPHCPWRLLLDEGAVPGTPASGAAPGVPTALSRALLTRTRFTPAELDALLVASRVDQDDARDGVRDGARDGAWRHVHRAVNVRPHHYVEVQKEKSVGVLYFRPETDSAAALAALWHELCLSANSTVHRWLSPPLALDTALVHHHPLSHPRHGLCAVSRPDDLGTFLAAAERRIKRGHLMYATQRWYCNESTVVGKVVEGKVGGATSEARGEVDKCAATGRPRMPAWAPVGSLPSPWLGVGPLLEWAGR